MRKRRHKVRGSMNVSCVEFCHLVSKTPSVIPDKNRMFLSGTTQSDLMGPFELPDNSQV